MRKLSALAVVLLLGSLATAQAEIYKCVRPDGSTFFTGDPAQTPADCQPEKVEGLPPLGILPDSPPPPAHERTSGGATPLHAGENAGKSLEDYREEASSLVEQYDAARRKVYRSSLAEDTLAARRELTAIRARKSALLNEISASALSPGEKRQLTELVAPITE